MRDEAPGRVVVFAAHYPPHVGGVERYTHRLWGHLASRGWRVLIVTADARGRGGEPLPDDLPVILLPAVRLLEGRVPVPVPSRELLLVRRMLLAAPPDVVACNTRFFPTSVLAAALARRAGRPLLHIEHGSAPVRIGRPVVDRLTAAFDRLVGGWVLRRATRCVGVSHAAAAFLRSSFGLGEVGVLPNGVETDGWTSAGVDYRQRLGLRPADVLVVHAGRLIAAKGVADLLEAFGALNGDAGRRVRLAIAGDGPLAGEVRRRAAADPRIVALGQLGPAQVHDLLVAADVLAHPSAYPEGLPTVLLEAAAAGTAIVATAAGGTTDLIRDGETGLIVPPGDRRSLQAALERLAGDAALRERLGSAARATVRERFDWKIIADILEGELSALRDRSPGPFATARRVRFDRCRPSSGR